MSKRTSDTIPATIFQKTGLLFLDVSHHLEVPSRQTAYDDIIAEKTAFQHLQHVNGAWAPPMMALIADLNIELTILNFHPGGMNGTLGARDIGAMLNEQRIMASTVQASPFLTAQLAHDPASPWLGYPQL